ncbi:MAG: hypothetical protein IJ542_01505 [Clostridia bacterium]|nr:hypothetical protein [Clostridia bacterium]
MENTQNLSKTKAEVINRAIEKGFGVDITENKVTLFTVDTTTNKLFQYSIKSGRMDEKDLMGFKNYLNSYNLTAGPELAEYSQAIRETLIQNLTNNPNFQDVVEILKTASKADETSEFGAEA